MLMVFFLKNYCIIVSSVITIIMNSFIRLFLTFFLVLSSMKSLAQDPHFSQFYANPMYLNPSYTGLNYCPTWVVNYRNQWPALPGDYVTYNTSVDFGVQEVHGGFGLIALHDNAGSGVLKTTNISLLYSYHNYLSSTTLLTAGVQFGYFQRKLDTDHFFGDQIDELYGFIYPTGDDLANQAYWNVSYTDLSAGIALTMDKYWGGLAVHHLTEPSYAFLDENNTGKLPMKMTLHGGSIVFIKDLGWLNNSFLSRFSAFKPHFIFQKQGQSEQLNIGANLDGEKLGLGLAYRRGFNNSDAIIILMGYEFTQSASTAFFQKIRIGYSYDLTVSNLGVSSGGSHEISIRMQLPCIIKSPGLSPIPCPQLF